MLIEDGILRGYLQDRLNARLMGVAADRQRPARELSRTRPMPRMTNTFMLAGESTPTRSCARSTAGSTPCRFGGGQVDITSGKFVFSASEAYLIEGGTSDASGEGRDADRQRPGRADPHRAWSVTTSQLDEGIGTCGKNGQSVPVGVGLPTIRIDGLTVGGTRA